jgi:hypothetical protein
MSNATQPEPEWFDTSEPTTYAEWAYRLADGLDALFDDTSPAFALAALQGFRAWEAEQA